MPVGEGAPFNVLAAQPDVDALLHEGAERHGLRQCPVHLALLNHLHRGYLYDIRIWLGRVQKIRVEVA